MSEIRVGPTDEWCPKCHAMNDGYSDIRHKPFCTFVAEKEANLRAVRVARGRAALAAIAADDAETLGLLLEGIAHVR